MIYDLLIVFSSPFLSDPLEMITLTFSEINLMIYLIDITNIDKICDEVGQKFKFLRKLVCLEAQEGAE